MKSNQGTREYCRAEGSGNTSTLFPKSGVTDRVVKTAFGILALNSQDVKKLRYYVTIVKYVGVPILVILCSVMTLL